ncbi:MAG: prolyl-tRNA synthetase [Parcubacteria group bacterium]|nr:prolyl-tRNA synthetase [Parcubacteria group bacterium]
MLFSEIFTKTRKEAPKGEVSKNARLLIRAGFIHKEMAGVYAYLPLGLRVLSKIENIVREEMNALGAQEVLLTALQNPELWKKSDRWEQDVWFKTQLKEGAEVGLGWTQEEQIVHALTQHVGSYKDLPFSAYQIQTKFRNEERAKSGILRGREFRMKDLYSFHTDEKDLDMFYKRVQEAYKKIFKRVGIGEQTVLTFASGGAFSKYSHEFQALSEAGEDTVYVSREKEIGINAEVYTDAVLSDLGLHKDSLTEHKAIEVGNIFKLGTRFSEALGLSFKDEKGKSQPTVMGCYGLGPSRVMGAIAEILGDDRGLVWPKSVAPFQVHLISLAGKSTDVANKAEALYKELIENGIETLYDDRVAGAGIKFSDAELMGIPTSIIISEALVKKEAVEIKDRKSGEVKEVKINKVAQYITDH